MPMRTASVVLDIQTQSLDSLYTYVVPDELTGVQVGCAVLVEFGARRAIGYIMEVIEHDEADVAPESFAKLKPLLQVLSASYFDEDGAALIQFIAHEYVAPLSSCVHLLTPVGRAPKVVKRGDVWELQKPARRRKKHVAEPEPPLDEDIAEAAEAREAFDLTDGQAKAIEVIQGCIDRCAGEVAVIDGVTGSGKTEVYLRAIRHALELGRGAIVLVPEIALTPQTVSRFEDRFGDTVAVMHSRMTGAERYDQWEAVRIGRKRVVVGARSALFCPMPSLGLVVIDEEHESTYKQESAPRYHARDVAAWMAQRTGAALVLGSATPSIETLCRTKVDDSWHRVPLPARANGKPMPDVRILDMAREFGHGSRSMFAKELQNQLFAATDAGHKAVLLLNQRGFANFLLCRECGYVPECDTCSVSLTYHEVGRKLVCHHCGKETTAPVTCPVCGSPYLKKFGAGTQRVEMELRRLLREHCEASGATMPRIVRMDSDTTSTRDAHEKLLAEFGAPGAAVLLGTQMIAKGLDFDEVVLVGVINADTQLRLPDFRSAERTFDLVEQVAGRAGRGKLDGLVLVQTYMHDATAIRAAAAYDRGRFLRDELPKRKMLGYPPYARLANILVWGADEAEVRTEAMKLSERVNETIVDIMGPGWQNLGAAPCAIDKLRGQHRWHILIKAPAGSDISKLAEPVIRKRKANKKVNVAVDVDPYSLL